MRALVTGCGAGVLLAVPGTAGAAEPVPADVQHDVVLVQQFVDEFCGLGAVEETMVDAVQVRRIAAADDSFHLVDVETGRIYEDWADEDVPDRTFRRTEAFTLQATRGGVFVVTQVFRQSNGDVTIVDRFHLTEVKGVVRADNGSQSFPDCP